MVKAGGFRRPSTFLRHIVEAALQLKRIASFSPSMEEKVTKLTIAIRGNGTLLNQIAHRVAFVDLIQAQKKLNDLEQLILKFLSHPW